MHVGLNLIFMTPSAGGTGTYARELIRALLALRDAPRLTLYAGPHAPQDLRAEEWAREVSWVDYPKGPESRWNLVEIMLAIPAHAARERVDLVHSPANVGPLVAPRSAKVVTLRDLIWLHHPDEVGETRSRVARVRLLSVRCARAADRIIAFSQAAADDFVTTLGLARDKIDVTPLGVGDSATVIDASDAERVRARLGLAPGRIVLSVAQRKPYKNLGALIRALPELPDDIMLVLAGAPDPAHEAELARLASELGVARRVRMPAWLPTEDLEGLYRAAECVVLPSFTEGFGLPVIEAMLRGVPVACSGRSALAEVAGDAALLFDPSDQAQITEAMRRLLEDAPLRERLTARGRERAAAFTWERTAHATMDSYRRALAA